MYRFCTALLCALCTLAPAARANPLDTFGFTARAEGLAGALTADATGPAAAHHNPAGVAREPDVTASIGYGYGIPRLAIDGKDAGVTTPRGFSLGLAVPVPIGHSGARAAFGLALYLPDQFIARIQLIPVSEARFVLLDNGLHHIVVTPVLALQPLPWLSIGAGATLLADAAGNGLDFDVGVVGGQKVGNAQLDVSLPIRAAPVAGLVLVPHKRVRLGLAYRGAIDLALKLDILAHVDIAGAVTGDTLISLRAFNFYTPEKISIGGAVDVGGGFTVHGELDWLRWSNFRGGVPDLRILLDLNVAPSLAQALFPNDHFRDVVAPRLAAEWRRALSPRFSVAARAGYAFERSPVPEQTGLTSFADADRHVIALGGGLSIGRLQPILERPLTVDVAFQWQELAPRTTEKDARLFPGESFRADGRLFHLAATLEAKF